MKPLHPVLNVDIAIIGGGIAGLWLLARLRQRGYGALLIENQRLGAGQTLCAQGIIHGGAKYSLGGQISDSAAAIAGMPEAWRRCLRGEAEVLERRGDAHGHRLGPGLRRVGGEDPPAGEEQVGGGLGRGARGEGGEQQEEEPGRSHGRLRA